MTTRELWDLPPHKFNEWRRDNDLPKLFEKFQKSLPLFVDWMKEYEFKTTDLINVLSPGEFIHGEEKFIISDKSGDSHEKYFFVEPRSNRDSNDVEKNLIKDKTKYKRFFPYIFWTQKKLNKKDIIPSHLSGGLSTLRYLSGIAPDNVSNCQWNISPGFQVLKLGGIIVPDRLWISGRILDFTNLDFLTIKGKYHGNTEQNIFYSHCHNLTFDNCKLNFLHFFECDSAQWILKDKTELYSFLFVGGNIWGLSSNNSKIRNTTFNKTSFVNFDLQNTYIEDINYIPNTKERHQSKPLTYDNIARNYNNFRVCYSRIGNRLMTKKTYYNERYYEMLANIARINSFGYYKKYFSSFSFKYIKYFIIHLFKDIGSSFKYVIKSVSQLFNFLLWGFGEKPNRLIICSFIAIILYSLVYCSLGITTGMIESLYFSIFSFVRTGATDIKHLSDIVKLLIGSEALVGWIMIALIINGYATKTKY